MALFDRLGIGAWRRSADGLDLQIRAAGRDLKFMLSVKRERYREIGRRFTEASFAQSDIWLRNPETLRAAQVDNPKVTPQ